MQEQSFIEYCDLVDDAMIKYFGIDTTDAGVELDQLADAQDAAETPEQFALWFGEKYDLSRI